MEAGGGSRKREGRSEGQAARVGDLRLVFGLGRVDADKEATGDKVAFLLEFVELVELHQGPPQGQVKRNTP